jgi:AhpD family alkylhydroperoxidase
MDNLESLGKSIRQAGPIQEKEVQLIQLAAAAAQKSEGAVHSHVSRAIEAGASPEEVRHALMLLVSTIGYPSVAAALSWADDILD